MTTPTPDEICGRLRLDDDLHTRIYAADLIQQQHATIERLSAAMRAVRMKLIRLSDGGDPAADDGVDFIDEVLGDRADLGKDGSDE